MRRADWSRLKMRTTRKALSKRNVEITRMSKNGSRDIVVMHTMTKSNTLKALVQNFQNQLHTMFITSSIRKMTVKATSMIAKSFFCSSVTGICNSTIEQKKLPIIITAMNAWK